jgi:GH25 family lysozyme M1 (1,4-beta-N-acetylmuramidase)
MPKNAMPENPIQKGQVPKLTRQESKSRDRHKPHKPIIVPPQHDTVPKLLVLDTTRAIVGPDVSTYQNDIDWAKMVNIQKNMGFAMCKATQGKDHIDSKFIHNITQMRETFSTPAGSRTFSYTTTSPDGTITNTEHTHQIAFGVYHYADITPTFTHSDFQVQADWFYNTVANAVNNNTEHFPNFWVLDWEDPHGNSIPHTTRANFAKAFVLQLHSKLINKFGPSYVPKIFIYTGYYYWGEGVKIDTTKWFTTYGPNLWMAAYTTINHALPETEINNKYNISQNINTLPSNRLNLLNSLGKWIVWQYTSSVAVPGILSRCDVSVVRSPKYWHLNFYQS